MKVSILNKFNCQSFPLIEDKTIEISEEDLAQIGVTKCFDVDRLCVVNYDNSSDIRKEEIQKEIYRLKNELYATDYKAIKYAEGLITYGDYLPDRNYRQTCRDKINKLEQELLTL